MTTLWAKTAPPLDQLPSVSEITTKTIFRPDTNGVTVPQEELSSLLQDAVKPFDKEAQTTNVSLLFPIKGPINQNIEVGKITACSKNDDINPLYVNLLEERRIIVPTKGSEIIVPVDNAEVFRLTPRHNDFNNSDFFWGIFMRFTGPDNTKYELNIRASGGVEGLNFNSILPALADAPEIGKDGWVNAFDPNLQDVKGKVLPAGTSVLKIANNKAEFTFDLSAKTSDGKGFTLRNFDFLTKDQKIIYIP